MVKISRLLAIFIIVVTLNCHVSSVESNNRDDTTTTNHRRQHQQQQRRLDDHTETVSMKPSVSISPSAKPSVSMNPSVSIKPSAKPSVSMKPSVSISPSAKPSSEPSMNPSVSINPSAKPSISMMPSIKSNKPSISHVPSISHSPSSAPSKSPSKNIVVNETTYNDTFNYAMILNLGPNTNTTRRYLTNTTYNFLTPPQQQIFCNAVTINAPSSSSTCSVTNQLISNASLHVHYQLNVTTPTLTAKNSFNVAYLTLLATATWGTQFLSTLNNATIASPHVVAGFALDYTLDACLCSLSNVTTTTNATNATALTTTCLPTPTPAISPKEEFRLCLWTNSAATVEKIVQFDTTVGHGDPSHGTTINLITNGVLGASVAVMTVGDRLTVEAVANEALYAFEKEGLVVAKAHGKVAVMPRVAMTATSRRGRRRLAGGGATAVEKNFSVDVGLNFTKASGGRRMGWSGVGVGILTFYLGFVTCF